MIAVRRAFVDGPDGQIHARFTPPVAASMPLVCLHATAYSSQSFLPLMQVMGATRQVIAIDAPGYGESDRPRQAPDMAGYAATMLASVKSLTDEPVALLGYHTGCYIAADMAIALPQLICAQVWIGVPFFQALDFALWKKRLAARHELGENLDQFAERWDYFITRRDASVSLERGFANFVDELRAWPDGSWAHEAMFAYDSDTRLPLITQPTLILNPQGHLAVASRAAAALLKHPTLMELPEVSGPSLESAPAILGRAIEWWLDDRGAAIDDNHLPGDMTARVAGQ